VCVCVCVCVCLCVCARARVRAHTHVCVCVVREKERERERTRERARARAREREREGVYLCVCVCVCVSSEFYVYLCKQLLLSSSHTHAWMHHVTRMRHATHTCVCTTSNIWMRHVIGILKRFFATLSAIGCISYINLTTTKNSQKLPAIVRIQVNFCVHNKVYGVATISRLLKIIGLICRI